MLLLVSALVAIVGVGMGMDFSFLFDLLNDNGLTAVTLLLAGMLFIGAVLLVRWSLAEDEESPQVKVVTALSRTSELSQLAATLRASLTRSTAGSAAEITVVGKELADRLYMEGGSPVLLYRVAALVESALAGLQALNEEAGSALQQLLCDAIQPEAKRWERVHGSWNDS